MYTEKELYLRKIREVGLENVLHVCWVDSVGSDASGERQTECHEPFLKVREDPIVHRVKVLKRLDCGSNDGPVFWS